MHMGVVCSTAGGTKCVVVLTFYPGGSKQNVETTPLRAAQHYSNAILHIPMSTNFNRRRNRGGAACSTNFT